MPTASRPPVPLRLGTATGGTEEGRAFFQARLKLLGGWIFLISGAFNLTELVLASSVARLGDDSGPFGSPNAFHLAGTLTAGAIWIICRGAPRSAALLQAVDVTGTILMGLCYALMSVAIAFELLPTLPYPLHAIYLGLLACSYVLLARSVSVPSAPRRTVGIGVLTMAPWLGLSLYLVALIELDRDQQVAIGVDTTLWAVAAVTMAAIASRVIFGLRAEVDKVRRLGQYTLEQRIGEGGMGVVYRARHAMLRRPTAVKMLPPEKAGEEHLQRFEREVQLTATLSHPSTVAIFDYGRTPEGVFYYAMEYLDGLNLDQLVTLDGPQSAARVIHILRQACGALTEAHGVGLIHRDVKPANIILTERGGEPDVAKVVDFGLVKHVTAVTTDATTVPGVTAANVIVGTPLYMSPEAVSGRPLDGRSDLYALGAVGYFLLTGEPVFTGTSIIEVSAAHLHTPPTPPSTRRPHAVPADLEAVILRCLAKAPGDRYVDGRALQRALEACAGASPWRRDGACEWWGVYRRSAGVATG